MLPWGQHAVPECPCKTKQQPQSAFQGHAAPQGRVSKANKHLPLPAPGEAAGAVARFRRALAIFEAARPG